MDSLCEDNIEKLYKNYDILSDAKDKIAEVYVAWLRPKLFFAPKYLTVKTCLQFSMRKNIGKYWTLSKDRQKRND